MISLLLATSLGLAAPATVSLDDAPVGSEPASVRRPKVVHDLSGHGTLPAGLRVWTTGTLVNLRGGLGVEAPVTARLAAGTKVEVVEDLGDWVEVEVGGRNGWVAREQLGTMGRVADLDGDGVEERWVVALDEGRPVVRVREGERVSTLRIESEDDVYLGDWDLVPAEVAGATLVRVGLGKDACGVFPTRWLSWRGDQLQVALGVDEWVDGANGLDAEVGFAADGHATVSTKEWNEMGEVVATSERECRMAEGVYLCEL